MPVPVLVDNKFLIFVAMFSPSLCLLQSSIMLKCIVLINGCCICAVVAAAVLHVHFLVQFREKQGKDAQTASYKPLSFICVTLTVTLVSVVVSTPFSEPFFHRFHRLVSRRFIQLSSSNSCCFFLLLSYNRTLLSHVMHFFFFFFLFCDALIDTKLPSLAQLSSALLYSGCT